ncbi:MAG: hypothetical protein ING44_05935 [Telmatospirillum sp.]|nr:hypothetical protein [Telmatospirillum sp.]
MSARVLLVAAVLAAFFVGGAPLAAQTAAPRLDVTWSSEGPLANVRIVAVPPVAMRLETKGREAVLRFARPVAAFEAGGLQRDLARFVESVASGFDTLVFVGTQDTVPTLRREEDGVLLVLRLPERPMADETAPDGIAVERAERRLQRLRAVLEAQSGQTDIARGRLARLAQEDPSDAEALAQLASVERQIGRPLRAANLLARAAALDPRNPDIAAARADLARLDAASVRIEPEYRRTSSQEKRYLVGTTAEAPINLAWRATAAFDTAQLDSPGVRRTNGQSGSFKGGRQRGAFGLAWRGDEGTRVHSQLFANAERVGAGLSADLVGDLARYSLGVELARPYWDFSESLVAGGTRDRVFAEYGERTFLGLDLRMRAGLSRYGLPGLSDGARSAALDGELRLPLDGLVRGASLAYAFDGEYPWRIARASDPTSAGAEYRPVPVRYREVHALLAGYTLDFKRAFDASWPIVADFSAGPAYDRYGHRGGPLLGASAAWLGDGSLQGGVRSGYGRGVGRDSSAATTIGGYLTWRM